MWWVVPVALALPGCATARVAEGPLIEPSSTESASMPPLAPPAPGERCPVCPELDTRMIAEAQVIDLENVENRSRVVQLEKTVGDLRDALERAEWRKTHPASGVPGVAEAEVEAEPEPEGGPATQKVLAAKNALEAVKKELAALRMEAAAAKKEAAAAKKEAAEAVQKEGTATKKEAAAAKREAASAMRKEEEAARKEAAAAKKEAAAAKREAAAAKKEEAEARRAEAAVAKREAAAAKREAAAAKREGATGKKETAAKKEAVAPSEEAPAPEHVSDSSRVMVSGRKAQVRLSNALLFPLGGDRISRAGRRALEEIAEVLKRTPSKRIEVCGHTDRAPVVKGWEDNWQLSLGRAHRVVAHLILHGVPASRLVAMGFADTDPVDAGDTGEAFARNRRVEIFVEPTGGDR